MAGNLEYQLVDGYIHNWLVGGPYAVPVEHPLNVGNQEEIKYQISKQHSSSEIGFSESPVDRDYFEVNGSKLRWLYTRCLDDHFIDVSGCYQKWQYLQTWASAKIKSKDDQQVTMVISVLGPVDVWLNKERVFHWEHYSSDLQHLKFPVKLSTGENELNIHFTQVATPACTNGLALRLIDFPVKDADKEIKILLPTNTRFPHRQPQFERVLESAYLEEVANYRGTAINLRWAEDLGNRMNYAYQIQDDEERIYVEGTWEADPTAPLDIGHPMRIFERPMRVVLRAPGREYFEQNLRYQRSIPLYIIDNEFTTKADKPLENRLREALEDAVKHETNLYAEIAKMEIGRWAEVNTQLILEIISKVNHREVDSVINMIGLLGMMHRYMVNPSFPESLPHSLEECVLNYKYWEDEPGNDGIDYQTESRSILYHACEVLAGELFGERIFTNSGKMGQWHQAKGENLAIAWMQKRGRQGFRDWNSNCSFELYLLALSHLTNLAQNVSVRELAAVLMDNIFFIMALNSYKGAFGSTHGRSCPSMMKSAKLEATSGISRMMWGMGVYNHHILGTVSLACSQYEFPLLIADIAEDEPEELWNKERHILGNNGAEVNLVTYKTPDYMLSSAQDYQHGEKGSSEHIWQATMGPDAIVFVNHPGFMSEHDSHLPGFWCGNQVLPRTAQWKDALVSVHNAQDKDWLGFTHAYFPTFAFDEYEVKNGWALARKGDGYLALTASNGLELIRKEPDGYRELRSYGQQNIWLCQMGRADMDGSFEVFKRKIGALSPDFNKLSVQWNTLRGDTLSFGWEEPFMVNGNEQPIKGFKHYDNLYCTADLPSPQLDIQLRDLMLRLNFI